MSRPSSRIRTGLTLGVAAISLLWLGTLLPPGWLAFLVVTVLAFVSVWELDRMGAFAGRRMGLMLYPAAAVQALVVGFDLFTSWHLESVLSLLILYLCATVFAWPWVPFGDPIQTAGVPRKPRAIEVVPYSIWLLPALFSLVLIARDFGVQGLTALVVLAKIGDNAGYFVGRAIGKRRPFPNISPGKTLAGCVASLCGGIVAGAVVIPLTLGPRGLDGALLGAGIGAALNLAAQAGDLSESWVKRRAGVKDSSSLVGPSGGVLDVIDSLFFAAPVGLLLWAWVY